MPAAVDDDRLAGEIIRFEDEQHRRRHVGRAARALRAASWRASRSASSSLHFSGSSTVPGAMPPTRTSGARIRASDAREVHDARLRDAVRDVRGPRLERREVRDVHDRAAAPRAGAAPRPATRKNGARRLSAMTSSHCSAVTSPNGVRTMTAAEFTSTSSPPNVDDDGVDERRRSVGLRQVAGKRDAFAARRFDLANGLVARRRPSRCSARRRACRARRAPRRSRVRHDVPRPSRARRGHAAPSSPP